MHRGNSYPQGVIGRAQRQWFTLEKHAPSIRANAAGENNATLFTLEKDGRFVATARLNAGSEIADLVLGLPP